MIQDTINFFKTSPREGRNKVCSKEIYFEISALPGVHYNSTTTVEVYGKQCLTKLGPQTAMMIHLVPRVTFTDEAVMHSLSVLATETPHHKNGQ